jgi:hypothetical protein
VLRKRGEVTPMRRKALTRGMDRGSYDSGHDFGAVRSPKALEGGSGGIAKGVSLLYAFRGELPRMLSKLSRNTESVPRRVNVREMDGVTE